MPCQTQDMVLYPTGASFFRQWTGRSLKTLKHQALERDYKQVSDQKTELETKNEELEADKQALQQSYKQVSDQKTELETKNEELEADKQALQQSYKEILDQKTELETKNKKLESDQLLQKEALSKVIAENQKANLTWQNKYNTCLKDYNHLKEDSEQLKKEKADVIKDVQSYTALLDEKNREIGILEEKIQIEKKAKEEYEERFNETLIQNMLLENNDKPKISEFSKNLEFAEISVHKLFIPAGDDSSPRGGNQKLFSLKLKREDKNHCFGIEFPTDQEYYIECNPIYFNERNQPRPWNTYSAEYSTGSVDQEGMFLANPNSETYQDNDWYFVKGKPYNLFRNATNGDADSWKIEFSGSTYDDVLDKCFTSPITITIIMKHNSNIKTPRLFFIRKSIIEKSRRRSVYRDGRL